MNEENTNKDSKNMVVRDAHGRVVSGVLNPKGKPVGTLDYQRRFFNEFIMKPILKDGSVSEKDKFQLIIDRLSVLAKDGNINAIRLILDYLLPKQKNEVELSGGIGVLTYSDILRLLKGEKIDEYNSEPVSQLEDGNK